MTEEFVAVALTFIIPQLFISVVQTVIEAAPLVLLAVSVTVEPLMLDCTELELELFDIV